MDSSVSPKDEIWFLRVCHHISNAVYCPNVASYPSQTTATALILLSCVCPRRGLHCGDKAQRSRIIYMYRWPTCHKLRTRAFDKHQGREFFLCSNVGYWSVSIQPSSRRDVFQTPCFRWGT